MELDAKISDLKGIGDALSGKYARLGIRTIGDLITYYPRRYDDYSQITKLKDIRPGQVTICVKIKQVSGHYLRRKGHITEAIATDGTSSIKLVWFNQPYRQDSFKTNVEYFVSGVYELRYSRFSIINPTVELKSDFPVNTARIVPKYRETKGLSSSDIRQRIKQLNKTIENLPESLPKDIIKDHKLIHLNQATAAVHFPTSTKELDSAKRRFGFEELFELILASLLNQQSFKSATAHKVEFNEKLAKQFVSELKFNLTDDQRRAIWQIYLDMDKDHPMNRLVEGDVGSGKTVVATMAGLMVMNQGGQVALMAPTELLARQHADTIFKLLQPLGLQNKVGLLIGSLTQKQKKIAVDSIEKGDTQFIIGTHALIQDTVTMKSLRLTIFDEQHRFGVNQRDALLLKAKTLPHILSLSATPIPRSLALTLFGELSISRLMEKPAGRAPVITKIVSDSQYKRQIPNIAKELSQGSQMFIVCPSIDSSAESERHSATKTYEETKKLYKGLRVGLIHGRLKADVKNDVMQKFVNRELDILVATTVIEVGIDIPNATIMVILSSDSFGLAQLHQLRGRIGRGKKPGTCYLVHDDDQTPGRRLRALETSSDGFKLAELDLTLRGPGAIYGELQHGAIDLRFAQFDDLALIKEARNAAENFVKSGQDLVQYPQLSVVVSNLQKLTNLN